MSGILPHLTGPIFLYGNCYLCSTFGKPDSIAFKFWYYAFWSSLSNWGWAAIQVSHMSLVPSLSNSRKKRDELNTLRNTFTYGANFLVLAIALLLFSIIKLQIIYFVIFEN